MRPGRNGGRLRTGGTNKGGPGRPKEEHLEWCRKMLSDPDCEKAVEAVLKDKKHPAFWQMWRVIAERGYGKPVQPLEHGGTNGGPITVEVVYSHE